MLIDWECRRYLSVFLSQVFQPSSMNFRFWFALSSSSLFVLRGGNSIIIRRTQCTWEYEWVGAWRRFQNLILFIVYSSECMFELLVQRFSMRFCVRVEGKGLSEVSGIRSQIDTSLPLQRVVCNFSLRSVWVHIYSNECSCSC